MWRLALLSGIALCLVAAPGCGGGSSDHDLASAEGTVEMRVTDAPFPKNCFSEASVTVDRIEIQPSGAQGDGGWVTVTTTAQTYNLLDLAGGISTTAGIARVPTGRYHKVRLHVSTAVLTWNDGTGFQSTFIVPGGKVDVTPRPHFFVIRDQTTSVLLDIDAARSFVQTGPPAATCEDLKQPAKIIFNPVVRAINPDDAGVVQGVVSQAGNGGIPGATITARDQADPTNCAATLSGDGTSGDAVGFYALRLAPGVYDLTFEAPEQTAQTATATVTTGHTVTVDATFP